MYTSQFQRLAREESACKLMDGNVLVYFPRQWCMSSSPPAPLCMYLPAGGDWQRGRALQARVPIPPGRLQRGGSVSVQTKHRTLFYA